MRPSNVNAICGESKERVDSKTGLASLLALWYYAREAFVKIKSDWLV